MPAGFQFQGRSSGSRDCGNSAIRPRTSASQACGSISLSLAVPMRVYIAAVRPPPRSEPANNHDFRPRAKGLSALSAGLFVRQIRVVEETGKAVPALEHVIHRPGHGGVARQSGPLGAHPGLELGDDQRAALPAGTARRRSAFWPLISRSMSNRASIRFTAASASGETGDACLPRRSLAAISASS